MGKILLYGYYGFKNFGDDLFERTFQDFLHRETGHEVITVYKKNFQDMPAVDYIFLGGGEILGEFFLTNLFEYIHRHKMYTVPIFGASIGFNENLHGPVEFCDFFDKCIFRNRLDKIVDNENIFYDHDIIMYPHITNLKKYLLPNARLLTKVVDSKTPDTEKTQKTEKKMIGLYLIPKVTESDFEEIYKFMLYLVEEGYVLNFILFDCKTDQKIANQYAARLKAERPAAEYKITDTTDFHAKLSEMYSCDKHFCMRFHSHVICYQMKVPFISFPVPEKTKYFVRKYRVPSGRTAREFVELLNLKTPFYKKYFFDKCQYTLVKNFFKLKKGKDKRNCKWFQIYMLLKQWDETTISTKASLIDNIINYYSPSLCYAGILDCLKKLCVKPKTSALKNNVLRIITNGYPKQYQFNPSIFSDNKDSFYLVREETNVQNWTLSNISYKIFQKMPDTEGSYSINQLKLLINGDSYESIERNNKLGIPLIEDIKLFGERVNGEIYGFCNILLKIEPSYLFSVGLVKVDPEQKIVELVKVFESPVKDVRKERASEKNWYLTKIKEQFFVVYKLFPLCIFRFDFETYQLTPYVSLNTMDLLETKYSCFSKNLSKNYRDITLSLVWGHFENEGGVISTLVRKKEKNLYYKYYPIKIYWNDDPRKIYFRIQNKIYMEGEKLYVNDIKKEYHGIGLRDQRYQIMKIDKK
jgi:hypothetical protein